jgi:hypothetical protein
MRHIREASKLVFQPVDAGWGGVTQSLERYGFAAGEILNFVHHAHSTCTETPKHLKAPCAGKIIVGGRRSCREPDRSFQEGARFLMGIQQALQFGLKRRIVPACPIQVALARSGILQ